MTSSAAQDVLPDMAYRKMYARTQGGQTQRNAGITDTMPYRIARARMQIFIVYSMAIHNFLNVIRNCARDFRQPHKSAPQNECLIIMALFKKKYMHNYAQRKQ